jgi:hypothetical protein
MTHNFSFPFKLFFFSGFSFISFPFPFPFSPVIFVALPIPKIDSHQRPFDLSQSRPEMQCGMG